MRYALLAGLAAAVGCGPADPPVPPAPTLAVALDGRPAAGLSLRLVTADGTPAAAGATGPDGRAVVRGADNQPPPPGTYKVLVVDLGEAEDGQGEPARGKPKSRVPAAYAKPATTPLTVAVEAGKMEYPVEVKSKG